MDKIADGERRTRLPWPLFWSRNLGKKTTAQTRPAAAIPTCSQKMMRQPVKVTITPPMQGPMRMVGLESERNNNKTEAPTYSRTANGTNHETPNGSSTNNLS